MSEPKIDKHKFHRRVDNLICNWSMLMSHPFTEVELNSLVDMLGDDFKLQASGIHAAGVRAGKALAALDVTQNENVSQNHQEKK